MDNISQAILEALVDTQPRHVIYIHSPREPGSYRQTAILRVMLSTDILNECRILSTHLKAGSTIAVHVENMVWMYNVTGRETTRLPCT